MGALTSLTFTLTNDNAVGLTGVGFTDNLPSGLVLTQLKPLTGACGGTITTSAASLVLADATLPAGGSCSFSVLISGGTAGVKNNTTLVIKSTEGGSGAAAFASMTVTALRPPPTTPPPDATTPAPPTGSGPGGTTKGPNKAVKCVVPKLTGKTLTQGKKLLTKGHCKLGKVSRKKIKKAKKGRIAKQAIKAGTKRTNGTKVSITLAR